LDEIKDHAPILGVDTEKNLETGLNKAVEIILSGGVVAFPTESFYGLAVNAFDEEAIQRLFDIKKRRGDHPILILISSKDVLDQYVAHISAIAQRLVNQFWPGGLTLVFEAGPNISPLLTAGTGTIGIRLSSHPIATELAKAVSVPITGTSTNISGQPACLSAGQVFHALGKEVDLILDGGVTEGGKGSTILDVTVVPPRVLREGIVGREMLNGFLDISEQVL